MAEKINAYEGGQPTVPFSNYVSEIWNIADFVRDVIRPADYNKVILPFVVLRRLECALEPTRKAVCHAVAKLEGILGLENDKYCVISKKSFYNTTKFTLNDLDSKDTFKCLQAYINGFSPNARSIFKQFKLESVCHDLEENGLLYELCKRFGNYDLSTEKISDRTMSNIYEHLIERYGESIAQGAEDFMTPRDVVRLAVNLVFANDAELASGNNGDIRTIYDGTAGTGGFISDALDLLDEWHDKSGLETPTVITPYGQELEGATWATGKANLLLRNIQNKDEVDSRIDLSANFMLGNTLTNDAFPDKKFNYQLANPPYGKKWENEQEAVVEESKRGYYGRFGAGLPDIGDGSMLFVQNVVSKMAPLEQGGGKAAIVLSSSPLTVGTIGKGVSNIRRWLLHKDLVESIIRLPSGIFFRTGITTYIWVLSNKKPENRKNKILLIDAATYKTPLQSTLGNKGYEISEKQIQDIVKLYADGPTEENAGICKMIPASDCLFRRITVQRPLRMQLCVTSESASNFLGWEKFDPKDIPTVQAILSNYATGTSLNRPYLWADDLAKEIRHGIKRKEAQTLAQSGNTTPTSKTKKKAHPKSTAPSQETLAKAIRTYFGRVDESFPPSTDKKGNLVANPDLRFTEDVPWLVDVQDYFNQKIHPLYQDAWLDTTVIDETPQDGVGYTTQPAGSIGIVGTAISFDNYFYAFDQPSPSSEVVQTLSHLYGLLKPLVGGFTDAQELSHPTCANKTATRLNLGTPSTKDSGIEWVGQMPANWDVFKLGQLFTRVKNPNTDNSEKNVLSLSYGKVIPRTKGRNEGLTPKDYRSYNMIEPNDIVLRLTDLQNDKRSLRSALVEEKGMITSAYVTIRADQHILPAYANYLLRFYDTSKVFYTMGDGIRQSANFDELATLPCLVPPQSEQQRIVQFLDKQCQSIEEQEKLLKTILGQLDKLRTSLIKEAVTGQIAVKERQENK